MINSNNRVCWLCSDSCNGNESCSVAELRKTGAAAFASDTTKQQSAAFLLISSFGYEANSVFVVPRVRLPG